MNTIYDGTYVIGQTSATNFQAGPGIVIDEPSEGTVRIANDETVLWSGNTNNSATLSEPITNFDRLLVSYGTTNYKQGMTLFTDAVSGGTSFSFSVTPTFSNGYASVYTQSWYMKSTTVISSAHKAKEWYGSNGTVSSRDFSDGMRVFKIIGINRISGSNA